MKVGLYTLLTLLSFIAVAQPVLIDKNATNKTKKLYDFLSGVPSQGIMFGHQDDLAYGHEWWDILGQSDVKTLTGKYPAVIGWEIGEIHSSRNLDSVSFSSMVKGIKYAYKMGAINTMSWHMISPFNGKSSWDQSKTVTEILPGGSAHEAFLERLDLFADFMKKCRVSSTKIPIVFRPFHEHNGNWFWWGKGNCTEGEYIQLWRFTVDYLKNEKNINNLIYAFSPDRSRINLDSAKTSYLYGYPGDEYVDVIGLDNYWDVGHPYNQDSDSVIRINLKESIRLISEIAREKNKIAALTETGNDGLKKKNWYSETLLAPIKETRQAYPENSIAWILVWRDAGRDQFFVPYKGHSEEGDFKYFEEDPVTLFLNDIGNPYK